MKPILSIPMLVLLHSCMCTPKADSVRIDGLFMASDTDFIHGTEPTYIFELVPVEEIKEAPKQHCLTYNKLAASDIRINNIVENSIRMTCDKKLGGNEPGQSVGFLTLTNKNIIIGSVEDQWLNAGENYTFTVTCRTTDSLIFNVRFRLKVH